MKRIILLTIAILLVFTTGGCARLSEKASEKFVEEMLENSAAQNGEDIDIDLSDGTLTIETGDGQTMQMDYSGNAEWPADIPGSIPKPDAAITNVIIIEGGWTITCDGANEQDYSNYLDDLYDCGFEKEFEANTDTVKSISGKLGKLYVMLSYSTGGYLSITVSEQ